MALTSDKQRLLPLLERPLTGGEVNTLLINRYGQGTFLWLSGDLA